jgi:hypothetical protein
MIKRQQRIEWIAAVAKEYLAAKSAADLLKTSKISKQPGSAALGIR